MPWLIGLVFALAATVVSAERLTTFAWDAGTDWPPGTTVELCGNGNVCQTGITDTWATLNLPVNPGDLIQGQARAVAPVGYQCGDPLVPCPYSDWATVAETWPAAPVGVWARFERVIQMATASDDFERADENPLAGNWTTLTSQGSLRLVSGNVRTVSDYTRSGAYYNAQAFSDDQFSEIVIADSASGDLAGAGPVCRASTSVATFYFVYTKPTGTPDYGIMLRRMLSGIGSELARYNTPVALNDVIRLVCNGSTISVTLNGSTVISVTDTEIPNGAYAGIISYTTGRLIGSWNAGDLTLVGSLVIPSNTTIFSHLLVR